MAFSEQDKANISANSLIGYCRSASSLTQPMVGKIELQRWVNGLLEVAETLATKLDKVDSSNNTEVKK